MRIAIAYSNSRKVGGIEIYLDGVIRELFRVGHSLAFLHEVEGPVEREEIALPSGSPTWCVSELGPERALAALRDWCPTLIYAHGLHDSELEREMLGVAPAVFFAHGYYGTCISGSKTFKSPVTKPCSRRFGWQCLLHYYPHRCGGLSPTTMVRLYRLQSERLSLLRRYDAIVTHSAHMLSEYLTHGLPAEYAYSFPHTVRCEWTASDLPEHADPDGGLLLRVLDATADGGSATESNPPALWRLLFAGRMDRLKGGHIFLAALPKVAAAIDAPLRVTFAGDGPERASWENEAARLRERHQRLHIEFVGWMSQHQMEFLLNDCDLLVVPSLWPEPFGLVGPEAGMRGVPAAAFAVGGIRDWLTDGINGYLAPGHPATAGGLAEAIIKCVSDPVVHSRLRRGAVELAQRFCLNNHIEALQKIFEKVALRHRASASVD